MNNIKNFELHWLSGSLEVISGIDISDAFNKAGYSIGAISALDYYKELKPIKISKSCIDGYLTPECPTCENLVNGIDQNKGIGCNSYYEMYMANFN